MAKGYDVLKAVNSNQKMFNDPNRSIFDQVASDDDQYGSYESTGPSMPEMYPPVNYATQNQQSLDDYRDKIDRDAAIAAEQTKENNPVLNFAKSLEKPITQPDVSQEVKAQEPIKTNTPDSIQHPYEEMMSKFNSINSPSDIPNIPNIPQQQSPEVSQPISGIEKGNEGKYSSSSFDEILKKAMEARSKGQDLADWLQMGGNFGNAMTGTSVNVASDLAKSIRNKADQNISDIGEKQKLEKSQLDLDDEKSLADSDSSLSKTLRHEYERIFGQKLPDNLSAKQMKNMGISLGKLADSYENRESREEIAKLRQAELDASLEDKRNQRYDKNRQHVVDKIEDMKKGRVGAVGKAYETERLAGVIEALINQYEDPNQLTNQQVKELVSQVDNLVSGGRGTISGRHELFPETYVAQFQNLIQKITNAPKGAKLGEFVTNLHHLVKREKDIATNFRQLAEAKYLKDSSKGLLPEDLKDLQEMHGDYDKLIQQQKSNETLKNKPKQIMQNGHTYILNEKTGEYE